MMVALAAGLLLVNYIRKYRGQNYKTGRNTSPDGNPMLTKRKSVAVNSARRMTVWNDGPSPMYESGNSKI